jgi:hypothetical protein
VGVAAAQGLGRLLEGEHAACSRLARGHGGREGGITRSHHDHDAPAWWHFKKKQRLYSDGFVQKDARPLMQFMLIPANGPNKFAESEADFREIYAWLESLRENAPNEPSEDRNLEVADFVAGFCSAHMRIWDN